MKPLLIPILFICIWTSYGQQYADEKSSEDSYLDTPLDENPPDYSHRYDELIERLFNGTPPPINFTQEAGPYDKFIFDPNDDENMSEAYRALLKLYFNHLLNETISFSDVALEEEIFWKMFKLTAAFLKYQHHLHGNDTLAPDDQNRTHIYNSSEVDTETFLKDMLEYYRGLAVKDNETKVEPEMRKEEVPLTSSTKSKISVIWNEGVNKVGRWWNRIKFRLPISESVSQTVRNITQVGVRIVKGLYNTVTGFFQSVPPSVIPVQYV